ncbi:DUF438 domain-containing protein [Thermanaeromonas sp. C210]|uniref:DUF438 domain-containing protein n=1 Tax=Thermanaeromonas sp. C210 TaxID=2731925 RepID=UPI00155D4FAA|nr:DUF438 domain-containing protein [Thermanaeromonas sp. C210]GFN22826.1 hypothetical protein TAMC210_11430 [Thermanaeromonas sp. C210]
MSELINNREYRKKALKEVITALHEGKSVQEVKGKFEEIIRDVSPKEISLIEQELIREGLPVEEVQRLCDVHAAAFKESLERVAPPELTPGHPVHTFKEENRALIELMEKEIEPLLAELEKAGADRAKDIAVELAVKLDALGELDKHYSRKENLLFPYLEKYQITGPPKVMWGVDDEIRALLRETRALAREHAGRRDELLAKARKTLAKIKEMIFKEEKILFPMALETLTEDEWQKIAEESAEIGFCLIPPPKPWKPSRENPAREAPRLAGAESQEGYIKFDTGFLTPKEISLIFNYLPVDITFVDTDNVVKYFSAPRERIFARTRAVIGRKVENCHPPASVPAVEKLLEDFKAGRKDEEKFWLPLGDKYVLIQYFAVRDEEGRYQGTLEVTMDIKPLQAIRGEKRLVN